MEQQNVTDMTPKEAKNVTTGSTTQIVDQGKAEEFQEENIESNLQICEICGLPKVASNTTENVFRAAPEGETQEEKEEVVVEAEAGEEQKEVLKGPNGMPLLGEIISGGNLPGQNNYYNNTANNTQVQVPTVPVNQPNQPPVVQPPVVQPPVIPTKPVQAPVPIKPPVAPQGQRPFQPPQVIHPSMPKQIIPPQPKYVQPPVQKPMMPAGRGPVNPNFKPGVPPKPYRVMPPRYPPHVIPPKVAPRPPEVIRPVNGPKKVVIVHPGKGPYGPQYGVFRNRKM